MGERIQEIIAYYQAKSYRTQAQRTYDALLEMIALDTLPGKEIFTEQELAQMLEIGRTPLREALKLLEFNRIIKTIPRLGIQVKKVRIEDYYLQMEVRSTLEKVVIRRACQLTTKEFRNELGRLNDAFSATAAQEDRRALYRVDRSIHALIDEGSKNPYAVHALEPLRFFEERVHYLLSRVYPEIGDVLNREHVDYIKAMIEGSAETACIHFDNMVASTAKLIQRQLDSQMGMPFYQTNGSC